MIRLGRRDSIIAVVSLCLVAACSGRAPARPAGPAHLLTVRATDYAFAAPDTVPAGFTRVRLESRGGELHHLQLTRIGEGHTFEEFRDSVVAGNPRPAWATPIGGPDVPGPAGSEVTLELREGTHAMICFMPSPKDRKSHFTKGMIRSLVVVPSNGAAEPEPKADTRLLLNDYSFTLTSALHAGRQTVRVENAAAQPHEAILFRLAAGKTPGDVLDWAGRLEGPPPGEFEGGTTAIASGEVNLMTVDLEPGDYVLLCFAPDAKDHRPHVAHGMVHQLRVA